VEEFLTGTRPAAEPDRVLATVRFTDIVASTERAAELGDRRWRDLLFSHHTIVRRELERFRGRQSRRSATVSRPPSTGRRGRCGARAPSGTG
jgi:class 3 adenylate cyclase